MSQTQDDGYIVWPSRVFRSDNGVAGAGNVSNVGSKWAIVKQMPSFSGTKYIERVRTVYGITGTGVTLKLTLEGVDSSGNPDGVSLGGKNTYSAPTAAATTIEDVLDSPVAVTAGQPIAFVREIMAGSSPVIVTQATGQAWQLYNYNNFYNGSSWSKVTSRHGMMALKFNDGTVPNLGIVAAFSGMYNRSNQGWASGNSPRYRGNKFILNYPKRVGGFWMLNNFGNIEGTIYLLDSANTVLRSMYLNSTTIGKPGFATSGEFSPNFFAPLDLAVGDYRVVFDPSASNSGQIDGCTVPSAEWMGMFDFGVNCIYTTSTNLSTWTDDGTRRMDMGMLITGGEIGGGGSGLINPFKAPVFN